MSPETRGRLRIAFAAVAAFAIGAVWYSPILFGPSFAALRGLRPDVVGTVPSAPELVGELARVLVVAYALSRLVERLGVAGWAGALQLGFLVGIGFQAMLLAGAVLHEDMPIALYAIHAGDALAKTLVMTVILAVPARRAHAREEG